MGNGEKYYVFKQKDQIALYFTLIEKVKKEVPKRKGVFIEDFGNAKTFEQSLDTFRQEPYYSKIAIGINNAISKYHEENITRFKEIEERRKNGEIIERKIFQEAKAKAENLLNDVNEKMFWRFLRDVEIGAEHKWNENNFQALKLFLGELSLFNNYQSDLTQYRISPHADLFKGKRFWVYMPEFDDEKQVIGISKARIDFTSLVKAEIEKIDPKTKKPITHQGEYKFSYNERYIIIELGNNDHQCIFEVLDIHSQNARGAYTNLSEPSLITFPVVLSEMKGKAFLPKYFNEQELNNENVPDDILKYFQVSVRESPIQEDTSFTDIHETDTATSETAIVLPISIAAKYKQVPSREDYKDLRDYIEAMGKNIEGSSPSLNRAKGNVEKSPSLPTSDEFITIMVFGVYILGVVFTFYWWPAVKLLFYRENLSNWDWIKVSILAIFWGVVLGFAAINSEDNKQKRIINRFKGDTPLKDRIKKAS